MLCAHHLLQCWPEKSTSRKKGNVDSVYLCVWFLLVWNKCAILIVICVLKIIDHLWPPISKWDPFPLNNLCFYLVACTNHHYMTISRWFQLAPGPCNSFDPRVTSHMTWLALWRWQNLGQTYRAILRKWRKWHQQWCFEKPLSLMKKPWSLKLCRV